MNINYDSVVEPIDNNTDFGNGVYYLTCDGKKCATMEQVMQYNQIYFDRMKKTIDDNFIKNK